MRRAAVCVVLGLFCGCSGQPSEAVRLAGYVDYATSYAHVLLVTGLEQSVAEDDATDLLLLDRVRELDEVDGELAAQVAQFETARPASVDSDRLRQVILHDLDRIDARRAAVESALQPRPVHNAVRKALAPLRPTLEKLRERLADAN